MKKGTRQDPIPLLQDEYYRLIKQGHAYIFVKVPYAYDEADGVFLVGKHLEQWTPAEMAFRCPLSGKGDEFWVRRHGQPLGELSLVYYDSNLVTRIGKLWYWQIHLTGRKEEQ